MPLPFGVLGNGSYFLLALLIGRRFCGPFPMLLKLLFMHPASKQEGITHGVLITFSALKYGKYSRACSNPHLRALIVPLQLPWSGHWVGSQEQCGDGLCWPRGRRGRLCLCAAQALPSLKLSSCELSQENKAKSHEVPKECSALLKWEAEVVSSV